MANQKFTQGMVISVNSKSFTIGKVEVLPYCTELTGTLQGDPSFLAGKRTIIVGDLKVKGKGYIYDWNAR